jgi:hypothetical protein
MFSRQPFLYRFNAQGKLRAVVSTNERYGFRIKPWSEKTTPKL